MKYKRGVLLLASAVFLALLLPPAVSSVELKSLDFETGTPKAMYMKKKLPN